MTVESLLQSIDAEIAKWGKLRETVEGLFQSKPKSHHKATKHVRAQITVKKRKLSKAARARIVAAQKKRWAKAKKAAKK